MVNVRYGIVWYGIIWHRIIFYGMVSLHSGRWHGKVRYARYSMVW